MKVTLLGSTGFVGKILLDKLLDAGHNVKVLVRIPSKLGDMAGRVTMVKGDFFRDEDIDAAIEGEEAVMSTIGPSKGEMSAEFALSNIGNFACYSCARFARLFNHLIDSSRRYINAVNSMAMRCDH